VPGEDGVAAQRPDRRSSTSDKVAYAAVMFLQQLEMVVADGQEAAFEAALCEARQRVFMSRGFRGFSVAQGAEHSFRYLVQVRWETLDELTDFVGSGRFERCWAPVEPFLSGPLRVDHFAERPSLTFQGPGVITDLAWLSE
jgi:heme-degrading monooxygenase HmoA